MNSQPMSGVISCVNYLQVRSFKYGFVNNCFGQEVCWCMLSASNTGSIVATLYCDGCISSFNSQVYNMYLQLAIHENDNCKYILYTDGM